MHMQSNLNINSKKLNNIKSIQDVIKEFCIIGRTSEKAFISSSTFSLLKIRGGFIFRTFPFFPSLLTKTHFSRIRVIILAAVSPSSYFDYLSFTISIPWKSPTPLMSPTKLYFLNSSSFDLRYFPVSLALSCSFWY